MYTSVHRYFKNKRDRTKTNPEKQWNTFEEPLLSVLWIQQLAKRISSKLTVECRQNLIKSWMSVEGAKSMKSRHSLKLMFRLPSLSILQEKSRVLTHAQKKVEDN